MYVWCTFSRDMGCSNGTHVPNRHPVDDRLPFRYRSQIDDLQIFWEYVKRNFEDTAKEVMIRFFRAHPYFLQMFSQLKELQGEQEMRHNMAFEAHALSVLSVFDLAIENLDKDVDCVLLKIEQIARLHAKIEGFHADMFEYLEDPLVESLRDKFWEKFTERHEDLIRALYRWIEQNMKLEVEAIHYRLIPGD